MLLQRRSSCAALPVPYLCANLYSCIMRMLMILGALMWTGTESAHQPPGDTAVARGECGARQTPY